MKKNNSHTSLIQLLHIHLQQIRRLIAAQPLLALPLTVALLLALTLTAACARIGSPDGGPYDETPPKIVKTSPKLGAANEKNAKKIVIEFDEIVKIDNPSEKVVISPPQIEQPEIEADGHKVTIKLNDSLKQDMTYTIDFADAIQDNNEGNPFGNFAFTFSTGAQVDTFQMSGSVLDASNLEPIKGMLVGMYKVGNETDSVVFLHDSVFKTKPFERISRTDSRGQFIVKGLSSGKYRAFALNDQNQNYIYDQKSEMVAFSERVLSTASKPDVRPDTIWHDSIHYDSIIWTPYTHFYPDDIVLLAFNSKVQDRFLLKTERPTLQQFSIYFTAPSDTLPRLTGLNFNADDAFIIDANERKDTLHYWIRDSLVYNIDTLNIQLDFYASDTLGQLVLNTDTLYLVPKLTKAKMEKEAKEKYDEWVKEYKQRLKEEKRAARKAEKEGTADVDADSIMEDKTSSEISEENSNKQEKKKRRKKDEKEEDIVIPPMPEEFLSYKLNGVSSMDPDKNVDFIFEEPLDSFDLSKIHFSTKEDSTFRPTRFLFRPVPDDIMRYRLYAEWEPDSVYQINIDTAAFVNIYGKRCEARKIVVNMKKMDSYSTLFVILHNADTTAIVQLLDGSDKPVKTIKARDGKADFYFINPGTYYLRLFYDRNGNGEWDTGDYDTQLQPEEVFYYPEALALKAKWEITQDWDTAATPLPKQKPLKITKQKPDKERKKRSKNEEREREKRNNR